MSSWTVTNFRSELRVHLGGLDTTDLPNTDADLLLNRAWWKVQEELKLPSNVKHTTFSTADGTFSYTQSVPVESILKLALNDTEQEKWVPLYEMSEDEYNESYNTSNDYRGKPTHYFRRGKDLILYPTPDATYSIEITRREWLDDLSDSITTIDASKALQEIVFYVAVRYGFLRARDFNAAFRLGKFIDDLIKTYVDIDVKEDDQHMMQVQVIRNEYKPT